LREQFAWMGGQSGYDRLFDALADRWPDGVESIRRTRSPWKRALFQPLAWLSAPHTAFYDGDSYRAERAVLRRVRRGHAALVHIAFVENNLRLFATRRRKRATLLVGTAHQPATWWRTRHRHPELLSALDRLVVLCRNQAEFFEQALPGRVRYIRHGVDTDFFCPAPTSPEPREDSEPRCVFGGVWMRDLGALRRSVDAVLARRPTVRFDVIVPHDRRRHVEFERLARHDSVTWHAGLSDEQLRDVYRRARLLLLPLVDGTANNTLLEAVACGLPVVTTEVGGVADYTESTFATRVAAGDVDGLVEAVLQLVDAPSEARARGARARAYALEHLPWPKVAAEMLAIYCELLGRDRGGHSDSRT
jgi:glycosyltransferase involved in cell wall biosynthesis